MKATTISVNITKGGCGKTTTVQALGEIMCKEYGKRVLCIDTDPQANLTTLTGIDLMNCQQHNLYTLIKEKSHPKDCILKSNYYDLIPGSLLLAYADTEFIQQMGREYLLKERIDKISADYDIILIDTPPALGILNIMSLTASSHVIIPSECSYLAMIGIDQLYNTIKSIQKYSNKELQIAGILPVKYSRSNLNVAVINGLERMAAEYGSRVFSARIRETVKLREAQSQNSPLMEWCPSCSAIIDYLEFAKELMALLS